MTCAPALNIFMLTLDSIIFFLFLVYHSKASFAGICRTQVRSLMTDPIRVGPNAESDPRLDFATQCHDVWSNRSANQLLASWSGIYCNSARRTFPNGMVVIGRNELLTLCSQKYIYCNSKKRTLSKVGSGFQYG
jgi:hypothetical protein